MEKEPLIYAKVEEKNGILVSKVIDYEDMPRIKDCFSIGLTIIEALNALQYLAKFEFNHVITPNSNLKLAELSQEDIITGMKLINGKEVLYPIFKLEKIKNN